MHWGGPYLESMTCIFAMAVGTAPKPKASLPYGHNSGIEVFAHNSEGDEDAKESHQNHLSD